MVRHKRQSGTIPMNTLSETNSSRNSEISTAIYNHNENEPLNTRYNSLRYKRSKHSNLEKPNLTNDADNESSDQKHIHSLRNRDTNDVERGPLSAVPKVTPGIIGNIDILKPNEVTFPYRTEGLLKIVSNVAREPVLQLTTPVSITLIRGKNLSTPELRFQFLKNTTLISDFSFKVSDQTIRFRYGSKGEGFGVILSKERLVSLSNNKTIRTRCLSWTCVPNSSESHKFLEVMKCFEEEMSLSSLIVQSDRILKAKKKDIDLMLHEYKHSSSNETSSNLNNNSKSSILVKFLDKSQNSSLNSINRANRGSGSGTVIALPDSNSEVDGIQSNDQEISHKMFYGSPSRHTTTVNQSSTFYVSNLRRATRSKSGIQRDDGMEHLSDDLIESETPEPFEPTLSYTFEDSSKISVNNQDFKCLYNHDWINDTILDFFLKFYIEKSISNNIVARTDVHLLSSFFYTKLVSTQENRYANVKKWVVNSDLFSKKFVVLPINMNYHWFGCIVLNLDKMKCAIEGILRDNNPDDNISFLPEQLRSSTENVHEQEKALSREVVNVRDIELPTVLLLVFDSLRQTSSRLMDALKEFIISYGRDVYNYDIPREKIKLKTCLVPQQPNMSDCGVHVILNTKKFFEKPNETLELWNTRSSHNHSKQVNEFFEKKERRLARQNLRAALWNLQKQQIENQGIAVSDANDDNFEENHSDLEIIEQFSGNVSENTTTDGDKQPSIILNNKEKEQRTFTESQADLDLPQVASSDETSKYFTKSAVPNERNDLTNEKCNVNQQTMKIPPPSPIMHEEKNTTKKSDLSFSSFEHLSETPRRARSKSIAESISSQPPNEIVFQDGCDTEELDDIESSSSEIDVKQKESTNSDFETNQNLAHVSKDFRDLNTSDSVAVLDSQQYKINDSNLIHCSAKQPRSILEQLKKTSTIFTQRDDEVQYIGQSTQQISKELSEELRESINEELYRPTTNDKTELHQAQNNGPIRSPSEQRSASAEEIPELSLNSKGFRDSKRSSKRDIAHIFKSGENKSYGKSSKISRNSFYVQSQSK